MKKILLFLFAFVFTPLHLFPQQSAAKVLRFDGVYFTKPSRQSSQDVWSVRCLRFYPDQTVILTSEVYPDQGFDMSRFGKRFNKEQLPPETARGQYTYRNDSLLFSTESYFTGASKRHTICNNYRSLKISSDTLLLEQENDYSIKPDTAKFYFRAFRKPKQE